MVPRLHMLLSRHARRGIALSTALVVLAASLGIPLPQPVAKDTSRPFPCMHHACGCLTAESCWQGCCCMSDAEKLAWADEHGVTPPATLTPTKGCCTSSHCEEPADLKAETVTWRVVRIDSSRKCQGLASLWMILGQALPPPECENVHVDLTLASSLAPAAAAQAISPAYDPATPPPRAAL